MYSFYVDRFSKAILMQDNKALIRVEDMVGYSELVINIKEKIKEEKTGIKKNNRYSDYKILIILFLTLLSSMLFITYLHVYRPL